MSQYNFNEYAMQADSLRRIRAAPNLRAATEVGFYSRSIDMVWLDTDDNVHAIELKLVDWRTAIKQIRKISNSCNYCYICMPPKKRLTKTMFVALAEKGIGYLEYQPPFEWRKNDFSYPFKVILPPKRMKILDCFGGLVRIRGRVIEIHESALLEARVFVAAHKTMR